MTKISFAQLLRLIFVSFSLFLMGDAFYRWDGFSYYASFYEFVPAVALVFIQWGLISVMVTCAIWSVIRLLVALCSLLGFRVTFDQLLLYIVVFFLLSAMVWAGKKMAFPLLQTWISIKLIILLAVAFVAFIFVKIVDDRFTRLLQFIHERITPLVLLFGAIVLLSIPIVSYHLFKSTDKAKNESIVDIVSVSDKDRPNIIFVTFDALTARDMSLYGYHRETTPFITKWAKNASVFTRVKAESTLTTSTIASLLTGKKLWNHQAYHIKSSVRKGDSENIAVELRNRGYHTMMYSENSNGTPKVLGTAESFNNMTFTLEGSGFLYNYHAILFKLFHGKIYLYDWLMLDDFYPNALFQVYYIPVHNKIFSESKAPFSKGITLLDKFITDIDKDPISEPFFVWIHLFPPHAPYLPPDEYLGVFESSPRFRTYQEQREVTWRIRDNEKHGLTSEDLEDLKILRARYNEHILFCDKEFEEFISNLEKRNLLKNSVMVVSSDHGEMFEHGHWGHGKSPHESNIHIPLIIKEPGQKDGKVIDDITEQIDITSTILHLADIPAPSWVEGRSLLPLMHSEALPPKIGLTMFFEESPSRGHEITNGFINAYESDHKLIYFIKENRSLLFNLKEDPEENKNIFDQEPETGHHLLGIVKENLEKANKRIKSEK